MTQYKMGCLRSPEDPRDFKLAAYVVPVALPPRLSYRGKMSPVKDQGSLGSCVAFAGAAMDEAIHQAARDLSEMWTYDQCKKLDKFPLEGTYPRVLMKVMQKGICEESFWPYVARYPPGTEPDVGATINATKYHIGTYAMADAPDLKSGLVQYGPMLLAIQIFENYAQALSTGIFPRPSGKVLGGHAVCLTGYDDAKARYEVKNSWGAGVGDEGYFYIPYSVLPDLFWEAWSVVDEPHPKLPWPDLEPLSISGDDLLSIEAAYSSGAFLDYEDGSFRPAGWVTEHQVKTVLGRLQLPAPAYTKTEWTTNATRGWVRDKFPGLTWKEERWDEGLTRYQLLLLVGRYIRGV